MRRFTKYSHYEDSELIRMADNSAEDLIIELGNRLDDYEPDHSECFNQDDIDDAESDGKDERSDEIRGEAMEMLEEVKTMLEGADSVRDEVVKTVTRFIEDI